MFDASDSDDDSGSEFFGPRGGGRAASSSSSGSESEGETGGGLLAQVQAQRAQRSALAAAGAGAKRPIVMRMAPLPPALAPAALPPPCKQPHAAPALLPLPPGGLPLSRVPPPVPLVGRGAPATERDPEGPPHVCFACNLPIAIYGKLVCSCFSFLFSSSPSNSPWLGHHQHLPLRQEPCSHVLCASCAKKNTQCPRCHQAVKSFASSQQPPA